MTEARLPPGPRAPSVVQAAQFGSDPYGFFERCAARYGPTFTMRLPGDPPRVVTSEPELVKRALGLTADELRSDRQGIHINLGRQSVLFADGERHRRQRLAIHPVLHGEALASYAARLGSIAEAAVARWPRGGRLLLLPELQKLTAEAFVATVFGAFDGDKRAELLGLVTRWLDATLSPPVYALSLLVTGNRVRQMLDAAVAADLAGALPPTLGHWVLRQVARTKADLVRALVDDVRACRARGPGDRTDVLARLVAARYEDGAPLSEDDVIDQLVTLFAGGLETTAGTLAWCLHHLLQSPAALERARAEALRGPEGDGGELDEGRELPFIDACIREGMRLSPVAPAISRQLAKPLALGPWSLPAGTYLWPAVYLIHRQPSVWARPASFEPERFLGAPPAAAEYLPWGGGRRRCIGAAFSALEMRIVLAHVLRGRRFRLVDPEKTRGRIRGITIVPASGVPADVLA